MRLILISFIFGWAQTGLTQTNELRKATSSNEIKIDLAYAVALEAYTTNPFLVWGREWPSVKNL